MPIRLKMKFVGDTTILTLNNLAIPGGGTYSVRLLIYERTYSGMWKVKAAVGCSVARSQMRRSKLIDA